MPKLRPSPNYRSFSYTFVRVYLYKKTSDKNMIKNSKLIFQLNLYTKVFKADADNMSISSRVSIEKWFDSEIGGYLYLIFLCFFFNIPTTDYLLIEPEYSKKTKFKDAATLLHMGHTQPTVGYSQPIVRQRCSYSK